MARIRSVLRRCVTWRYLETAPSVPMYGVTHTEPRWLTEAEFERLAKERKDFNDSLWV